MHDLKTLRDAPAVFDAALSRRGMPPQAARLLTHDAQARTVTTELQGLQAERNAASKDIGQAKAAQDTARAAALMEQVSHLKARTAALESQERDVLTALEHELASLPNLPHADTPDGIDASANRTVAHHGTPPVLDFLPLSHEALGERLGLYSAARAAKLSGARFVALQGGLARLERALAAFMLDVQTQEFGYTEVSVPYLVRDTALYGTSQLPKFSADLFQTTAGLWLIPTAEVSLTNLVADEILSEGDLPLRFCAATPCFRSEAGSAGRDTTGMIRVHQFLKVELVHIATPEQSEVEFLHLQGAAASILQRLELPYRKVALCAGDLGFAANRTFDLEVWLPAQNAYREISSCSHFDSFQARRMNSRFRDGEGKNRFVHTLNGSGLAVGRTLVAVLENYQRADGSVVIPPVLRPYMGGLEELQPVDASADKGVVWRRFSCH
jgi:seryl-tRNA synthetase